MFPQDARLYLQAKLFTPGPDLLWCKYNCSRQPAKITRSRPPLRLNTAQDHPTPPRAFTITLSSNNAFYINAYKINALFNSTFYHNALFNSAYYDNAVQRFDINPQRARISKGAGTACSAFYDA